MPLCCTALCKKPGINVAAFEKSAIKSSKVYIKLTKNQSTWFCIHHFAMIQITRTYQMISLHEGAAVYQQVFFNKISSSSFQPVVIHCLAALDLGSGVEQPFGCPSDRAVHREVHGLDIVGQHGRRFVLLRHTHRPQGRPYLICTSRSGNVRRQCWDC